MEILSNFLVTLPPPAHIALHNAAYFANDYAKSGKMTHSSRYKLISGGGSINQRKPDPPTRFSASPSLPSPPPREHWSIARASDGFLFFILFYLYTQRGGPEKDFTHFPKATYLVYIHGPGHGNRKQSLLAVINDPGVASTPTRLIVFDVRHKSLCPVVYARMHNV